VIGSGARPLDENPSAKIRGVDASPDARTALLRGLIDHAPLFPPASLDLPAALAEDRRARESTSSFALGRLVWPASRLDELPTSDRALSVVLDGEPGEPGGRAAAAVEAVFREDLGELAGLAPDVYVEVPIDEQLELRLDSLVTAGLHAKVRCGGSRVPTAGELARFLHGCRERGLAFKATAGLHHAVRTDGEHGFLNVLAAVVFGDAEVALAEDDPHAFAVDADGLRWRDRVADNGEIERARRERLHAIGSCSFFEPIEELAALGALP
jgi:hypothetical protein